jgi:deoxyhypusine synthase
MKEQKGPVGAFMLKHYKHFNSAALLDAAQAYEEQLHRGNKMMVTLAGAMSTAELGKSLAEMIRQDKVHIISCTGANLEEDLMNLVAHKHYKRIPEYRDLTAEQERELMNGGLNRVTDTCIPEEEAFRRLQKHVFKKWKDAEKHSERYFPHEYLYQVLLSGELERYYEIDPADSWMLAAAEKNLPLVVPGWEDSTLGNIFASYCIKGELQASTVNRALNTWSGWQDGTRKTPWNMALDFSRSEGASPGIFPSV